MKKYTLTAVLLAALLIGSSALAFTIDDTSANPNQYWGGSVKNAGPSAYGDVIGAEFAVDGLTASVQDGSVKVRLTGAYFYNNQHNVGLADDYGPGDLYLSTSGWRATTVSPDRHYTADTFTQSEGWNYVVTNGGLYALNWNAIQWTEAPSNYVWRQNQAWRGGATGPQLANATVQLGDYFMEYTITPLSSVDPEALYGQFFHGIGLHWTMKCGNDVVEGGTPTPVPPSVLLLSAGLVGVVAIRRRFSNGGPLRQKDDPRSGECRAPGELRTESRE